MSVICRVTYVQIPIHSPFLPHGMGRHTPAALRRIFFNTQYWTLDDAENWGRSLSSMEGTADGKYFVLISTVSTENRHPAEGYYDGFEFRLPQYVIVAELRWPEVAISVLYLSYFCTVMEKNHPMPQKITHCV